MKVARAFDEAQPNVLERLVPSSVESAVAEAVRETCREVASCFARAEATLDELEKS